MYCAWKYYSRFDQISTPSPAFSLLSACSRGGLELYSGLRYRRISGIIRVLRVCIIVIFSSKWRRVLRCAAYSQGIPRNSCARPVILVPRSSSSSSGWSALSYYDWLHWRHPQSICEESAGRV